MCLWVHFNLDKKVLNHRSPAFRTPTETEETNQPKSIGNSRKTDREKESVVGRVE